MQILLEFLDNFFYEFHVSHTILTLKLTFDTVPHLRLYTCLPMAYMLLQLVTSLLIILLFSRIIRFTSLYVVVHSANVSSTPRVSGWVIVQSLH